MDNTRLFQSITAVAGTVWIKYFSFISEPHVIFIVLNRYSLITNCNHKTLGLYYLWFSFLFGSYGFLLSVILRTELYSSSLRIIAQENVNLYNMIFTIHGIIMIFFNIMPGLFGGFGNYFLPILCGSPELAYPRINSISLLLQPIAFVLVILSTAAEFGGGTGWTLYPPLSTSLMSLSPVAVDVIIFGLLVSGVASIMSSLNFITTVMHLRAKGLTLGILSVSTWSLIITSGMLLLTLPVLTGGVLMLL
ncbi:cytochrome oxidase I [Plasmodium falciparum Dd2]|nr:cytochrome oxidase I [Plasmodium falciparum Dd2]